MPGIEGIIGRKLGMTQVFGDNGKVKSVTAIEAGPCVVTQVKSTETDGYNAAQLGFGTAKRLTSPEKGHLKDLGQFKHLHEFRLDSVEGVKRGDKVDVSLFKSGDIVDITGISKGKGFAGVVKRYHFKGGHTTRGQSDRTRAPGSIGASTSPGRVWKGQRMGGHMGNAQVTERHLEVATADTNRNLLLIEGAVPGARNGIVLIRKSSKGS